VHNESKEVTGTIKVSDNDAVTSQAQQ